MARGPDSGVTYFLTVDLRGPSGTILNLLFYLVQVLRDAFQDDMINVELESEGYGEHTYPMRQEA